MFCKFALLTTLATCAKVVLTQQTDFKLYAYGTGLATGLQLFYGDGNAYIGASVPSFVSEAVFVTLSQNDDETEFLASPDSTVDWASQLTMYVDTTGGSLNTVGFVKGNETVQGSGTTSGFGLYGGWAFHKNSEEAIEMKFVATPTNETDIYLVKWNAGGTTTSDDVPISLRTQAPAELDRA